MINGVLEEEIFMSPPGFVEGREHLDCRLKRSLYGLKYSPRCWNSTLDKFLQCLDFVQSTGDPHLCRFW